MVVKDERDLGLGSESKVLSILSCGLSHDSPGSGARLAFAVYDSVIAVIFSVLFAKSPAAGDVGVEKKEVGEAAEDAQVPFAGPADRSLSGVRS